MSLPERNSFSSRLRLAAVSLLATGLLGVSACTVQPLYSDGPAASGTVTGSIASELSAISVKPVTTRVGQEVRNKLLFLLYGGQAEPAAPSYTLLLVVSSISEASANIQVNTVSEPTAAIDTVRVTYQLRDSTGTVVATGKRQFAASYDVPRQEFAAVRARIDAENRAAREVAELIRLALAHDLAMGSRSPDAPADAAATN
jgi:LPS-assembly lipoprotein